jgi:hypothetical protein
VSGSCKNGCFWSTFSQLSKICISLQKKTTLD